MTVSLGSSLASEGICLFDDLCSLVSETQNEIVVSWITMWGVMKVYWLDLTLAYIFDHAVVEVSEVCSANKHSPS